MTRLALALIARATPLVDRDAVVGDTIERLEELRRASGEAAARRWLWRETLRVIVAGPGHRRAAKAAHRTTPRRREGLMTSLWRDARLALRWFGRSPGFTALAAGTLAIGLGANTAMFAVVNAVLLKPLPFPHADRLMLVSLVLPPMPGRGGPPGEMVWSYPKYRSLLDVERVFDETALFTGRTYSLSGDGEAAAEQVRGELVTHDYLSVLGVQPLLGRSFTADEAHRPGAEPVAMIGHGLWTRRYGGAAGVLGRRVAINGVPHAIVGVLPRGFRGLNGNADVWTPMAVSEFENMQGPQSHSYSLVARRRADVPEGTVLAALPGYGAHINQAHPDRFAQGAAWGITARSLQDSRLDADLRQLSFVVLGAVGFVLLIACANIATLLVARTMARHREVAIRVALGAGRRQIARQLGVEGLLIAGAGAIGGVIVAAGLLAIAKAVLPDADVFLQTSFAPGSTRMAGAAGLTRVGASMIRLDWATLAFTAGLMALTATAVSVLPVIHASRARPWHVLKQTGGAATPRGARGFGSRAALVAGEIAVALVLLAGAGLMLRSALLLQRTPLGADPTNVLTAELELPGARYTPERGRELQHTLLEGIRAIPGVDAAGWTFCVPVSGRCNGTLAWFPPQPQRGPGQDPLVGIGWATPGYFEAFRIPVLEGRHFTEQDREGQPRVVLVNETAARTFWPGESAIGKRLGLGQGGFHEGAEVIGVVADVRYRSLEGAAGAEPGPFVYLPPAQSYRGRLHLVVRSRVEPRGLIAALGREVRDLDAALPLVGINIKMMDERLADAMWRTRVTAWLLSALAGLAMLLTAMGVFGVMAQTVAQRTPEFGVRMALGAERRDVLGLVLRRAVVVTAVGVGLGLAAALALTRVLSALLHGVTPTDPATLGGVAAVLSLVSLAAAWLPARRAARIDPLRSLREE